MRNGLRGLLFCSVVLWGAVADASDVVNVRREDGRYISVRRFGAWPKADPVQRCAPLVIWSHGLGSGVKPLKGFMEDLADAGYLVLAPEHPESGQGVHSRDVLVKKGNQEIFLTRYHEYRFKDLAALLLYVREQCEPGYMALGGTSFGGGLAIMAAGGRVHDGVDWSDFDQFDAYVAITPPSVKEVYGDYGWGNIQKPLLVMTGTDDDSLSGTPDERMRRFELLPNGNKRFVIVTGVNHSSFHKAPFGAVTSKYVMEFLDMTKQKKWYGTKLQGNKVVDH